MDFPIKQMGVGEFRAQFEQKMAVVVDAYFGSTLGTTTVTINECREIMLRDFPSWGIGELMEAARNLEPGQIKTFGQFTVDHFKTMLFAHQKKRNAIAAAIAESKASEDKLEREKIVEGSRIWFRDQAENWFLQQKNICTYSHWSKLPYGYCLQIAPSLEENIPLKHEAMRHAADEMQADAEKSRDAGRLSNYESIMAALRKERGEDQVLTAKKIYPRLLVWNEIKPK